MVEASGVSADNSPVKLPIIDVSRPSLEVGKQMLDAAVDYGFFYVDSRNVPDFDAQIVERLFDLVLLCPVEGFSVFYISNKRKSKTFFSRPKEEKAECAIKFDVDFFPWVKNKGWLGIGTENLDPKKQKRGDFKEALNIYEYEDWSVDKPSQKIPISLMTHVEEIGQFQIRCRSLCNTICDLLALGLEIADTKWLTNRHRFPSSSTLRLLYYPSMQFETDLDEADIRAGAHSDYGSITLLFQRPSQPGLEILPPNSATWSPVPVFPPDYPDSTFPPILVNIADLLSYWTNGLLKSTVHRVIFPKDAKKGGEDRYSIAYFCHPWHDAELEPVPSQLVQERGRDGEEEKKVGYGGGSGGVKALTAWEHLERRLDATYKIRQGK